MVALTESSAPKSPADVVETRAVVSIPGILLGIVAVLATVDVCWARWGRFDVDGPAYAKVALLAAVLGLGSAFYARIRKSPELAAMLFGAGFLVAFSAATSVLNYFLLRAAGHRIDLWLAGVDRSLGIDWPAMMAFVAAHPLLNLVLRIAYVSVLPQVALLLILLGLWRQPARIYDFCLALAIGAIVTIAFWTVFPSFGAFSVFQLPRDVSLYLHPELGPGYAQELIALLRGGPGRITPHEIKGLIGFPSFHAAMAVLVVWYGRSLRHVRWPLLACNIAVLIATPIHGGHFVVDVVAGVAVAAAAVGTTAQIARLLEHRSPNLAKTPPAPAVTGWLQAHWSA